MLKLVLIGGPLTDEAKTSLSGWRSLTKGRQRPFCFSGRIRTGAMDRDGHDCKARKPARIEMTGAEMVIRALKDQGVKHIFGYPGGAVLPIYDALFAARRDRACAVPP